MIRPTSLGLPLLLLAGPACTPDKEETLQDSVFPEPLTFTVVSEGGLPSDATPTADGSEFYAIGDTNGDPTLFHVDAEGTQTTLVSGAPMVWPHGVSIAPDDSMIYVADLGYTDENGLPAGAILAFLPDGTLSAVLAEDTQPRSVQVEAGGDLLFTGATDGDVPAVFRLSGGTQTVIASGEVLADIGAATSTASGEVYVAAGINPEDTGALYVLNGSVPEQVSLEWSLNWTFPTGLSSNLEGTQVLMSLLGNWGNEKADYVLIYNPAGGYAEAATEGQTLGMNGAGLHRAANADIWAFCDGGAGGDGKIYRVTPNE